MQIQSTIFREYDIRGVVGETLDEDIAYRIGRAFAARVIEEVGAPNAIAVGRDGRVSSSSLQAALMRGIADSGVSVIDIGLGPTPMLYYAVCTLHTAAGVMLTGSHNPPTHNGFKMMLGTKPFFGADIQALHTRIEQGQFASGSAEITRRDIGEDYITNLLRAYTGKRNLRVAWDAGNGAAGGIMQALCERLPGEHIALYSEIDGTFPNHHPDPTVPENLQALIETVKTRQLDFGIAFDGDGDRIGVVDDTGEIIWGDQLLALYAGPVLKELPGATIIGDVKASQMLFDEIKRLGGEPLMWKTGHSHIKSKMKELKAPLAGEMSGHVFFADRYFGFDDALYAAIRLLSLVAEGDEKLSALRARLPVWQSTPELRLPCDEARKFKIIEEIQAQLKAEGAEVSTVDGVRVTTPSGWWLLRASNTQAMLVARAESRDAEGLAKLVEILKTKLAANGVEFVPSAGH